MIEENFSFTINFKNLYKSNLFVYFFVVVMNQTIKNYEEEKDDEKKLNCLKFYVWAMEKNIPR